MRLMNTLPAAAGLLLLLAAGTFAAPIGSEPAGLNGGHWTIPATYAPWDQGWAFHRAHRPHRLDLRVYLLQYGYHSQGAVTGPWNFRRPDEEYPVRPWLCGGEPGAGLSQYPSDDDPVVEAPDEGNPVPAVPEPGSLAMLGAGALGLIVARSLLKNR